VNRTITVGVAVRDLTEADLGWIAWSGGPDHPEAVAAALRLVDSGEVAYLAVCGTNDLPLAIGGIDYRKASDGGTLWQLAVHPGMQSCGLGSLLIASAEDRIRGRGLRRSFLSVEDQNHRARALYRRLGYVDYGNEEDSWPIQDSTGNIVPYRTSCTLMRKNL